MAQATMCSFDVKGRFMIMRWGRIWSTPLIMIVGIFLLAGLKPMAVGQTLSAKPAQTGQDVLPVYIEEFFLSEAVRSEEHGELQFTIDTITSRGKGSAADGKSADLDIEYGITKRLQLGMEVPYGIQSTASSELPVSWSSLNASLLYQFIRSNHPFALSGSMGVNVPLTSRGEFGFEPELLIAKAFGKLQIHTSVIPELSDDDKSLEYNVAAVRPLAHHLIPTLEFNGRRNKGLNSFYVTPGMYKHLPRRMEIGMGVPVGVNSQSSPIGVVVKMTLEFGGDDDD
ncbi:MAG: hypothetical protein ABR990_06670 [Terracidiphilus sp.]|jgi:hypothetical protein